MSIFDQMLARYEIKTNDDYINAQHEVMQQIAQSFKPANIAALHKL